MIKDDARAQRGTLLQKRQVLARALLHRPVSPQFASLTPREGTEPVPLSFAQERLWFLDRWNPQSSFYNVPKGLRLLGVLAPEALHRSLAAIVARHEILRTAFPLIDERPVQLVRPDSAFPFPTVDLSLLPESEREHEMRRLVLEEAIRPFVLAEGPLIRGALFRLRADEHVLLLTLHHIVTDAWSTRVLGNELTALYGAFTQDEPDPLPPLPIQYADFAIWQRNWLQGEALENHLSYWRTQIVGAPAVLELPTDRPRPAHQTFQGTWLKSLLPREVGDRLAGLSSECNATLFMTFLAAFLVLLYRYSGQEDIVVGTPIANRTRAEVEALIGFFTNTLALRVKLTGDLSFRELLGRVRETALGAYAHQDLPFEKLVEELQPERSPSHSPIFQVMFMIQSPDRAPQEISPAAAQLSVEPIEVDRAISKQDLMMGVCETDDGPEVVVEYSTDLFDKERMERLLTHYRTLLEDIVADPDQRVSRLQLLTESERQQVLTTWNDTAVRHPDVQYPETRSPEIRNLDIRTPEIRTPEIRTPEIRTPGERCLHEFVEEQTRRTPDAVAIEYKEQHCTYAELNRRSDTLASALRSQGVGPESRIGLCAERSLEMMIGVLGILKAGAAYVPVDPTYPADRVAFIFQDAGVALVLTYGEVQEPLAASDVVRMRLDEVTANALTKAQLNEVSTNAPTRAQKEKAQKERSLTLSADCAAYVLYTSGSTGRPKGVILSHAALVNLILWQRRIVANPGRTLQFASIGFDASFHEIFMAWATGSTLVVVDEETRRDPPALLRFMEQHRLETVNLSVAVLQQLAVSLPEGAPLPSALRVVLATAEQLQITDEIRTFFNRPGAPALYNHYGPTEAHVVTKYEMPCRTQVGDPHDWPFLPPIGRPIDNARIYLLDNTLTPVPIGVPGELYIGGVCLARGYLDRPDLTAEKFLPNPFSDEPGSRLYRAGDLARYLPDGNIEYLGRIDHQVKIRGFRIELGEIESVLLSHPGVREAVVLAREDAPGDRRLVAYVVGQDAAVSASGLREHLREKLAEYMVPSAFVPLEALPLNSNGKVDRKALPAPDSTSGEHQMGYVPPRTTVEEILAEIWSRVLRTARVGIYDSFFELGGHSLLVTQVVARIREVFHVDVPLHVLFENPTIAALAPRLTSGVSGSSGLPETPLRRADRGRSLPLSFAQERLWFMDRLQPDSSLLNFPMALRLSGKLDVGALERALEALQRRHEVLRTVFAVHDGEPVQIIADSLDAAISYAELEPLPEDRQADVIERLVSEEARRPFDLAHGPIYRCHLIRLASEEREVLASEEREVLASEEREVLASEEHEEREKQEEHVMVVTLHHIVADETSATVFLSELSQLYRAELKGTPVMLPELAVQYADYAVWQRGRFDQGPFEPQVNYWKRQLRHAPPFMEIPTDYPRPASPTFARQSHRFTISREAASQVARLCHEEISTPFMFYLAVFQLLLSRCTGRQDILVGTDTLNRDRLETQSLIGFFINQLVLRTDLSGCTSFRHLLRRVRGVALEGYANQELPFNKLVEMLKPARDPERPPLYQVKLAYTRGGSSSFELEGLSVSGIQADKGTAQLDLTLFLREHPDGVFGRMEYREELYRPATIARLGKDYEAMVQVYSADPDLSFDPREIVATQNHVKSDARERLITNRAKLLGKNKS